MNETHTNREMIERKRVRHTHREKERERERDRQTDRQTDRQKDNSKLKLFERWKRFAKDRRR